MSYFSFAVIPTRNRPDLYRRCVESIRYQVDEVITVAHRSPRYVGQYGEMVVPYFKEPPNISEMWNLGLNAAYPAAQGEEHWVAILNDDAAVPPDWFETIRSAMEREGTVLGAVPHPEAKMIQGWAFVLKGGTLRADERWSWWASDNYLVKEANEKWGGWSKVEGLDVLHDQTPLKRGALLRRAILDRERWIRENRRR